MKPYFEIYSASAGSGKTFKLTSKYLHKLLTDKTNDCFKKILALTFTNKACEEMKTRIIGSLSEFSNQQMGKSSIELFKVIKQTTGLKTREIQMKSEKVLQNLLHNYSFFQISTIDSFNHSLIKSFSNELNIISDFQVILDPEEITDESIENLMNTLSLNKTLSKLLVDFSYEKLKNGKTWDIRYDLRELSSTLHNENYAEFINYVKLSDVQEFVELKKKLEKLEKKIKKRIKLSVNECNKFIDKLGLKMKFNRATFLEFLKKAENLDIQNIKTESIEKLFLNNRLFKKAEYSHIERKHTQQKLLNYFHKISKKIWGLREKKALIKSIVPISVLNIIREEIQAIQLQRNEILISDFNSIICNEIKDQPAPIIYEKVGSKIDHFFIDEFQDTSKLQWSNIVPLISHTLESCDLTGLPGSLILFGDVKQSLYRWRGADPDNFISLLTDQNPFRIDKKIERLSANYRSEEEIVKFNNSLFSHLSKQFEHSQNQLVYKDLLQDFKKKDNGYVSIEFSNKKEKSNTENYFLERTLSIINGAIGRGFIYSDQCVLVRNRKEQKLITEHLVLNNIPCISGESLLISSSEKVQLLLNLLKLKININNLVARKEILLFFLKQNKQEDEFLFFQNGLKSEISVFFEKTLKIEYEDFTNLSISEFLRQFLDNVNIDYHQDSYVQFFLNELHGFLKKKAGGIHSFLQFFNKYEKKLFVSAKNSDNSVTVLTIHKAKGLEFPLIIYPFADSKTHVRSQKKIHYSFNIEGERKELLIDYNKGCSNFGESGKLIYNMIQKQEELDNVNVLYVALTRAISELYVICTAPKLPSMDSHNAMLWSFVKQLENFTVDKIKYSWGKKTKHVQKNKGSRKPNQLPTEFRRIIKPNFYMPILEKEVMIGDLFHQFMSKIEYSHHFNKAKTDFLMDEKCDRDQALNVIKMAQKVLNHKELKRYFSKKYNVICEKEIYTADNKILIPDRIIFSQNNKTTLIDYKTGLPRNSDINQVISYASSLRNMGFDVEKTLLVYVGTQIKIVQA
ncbi:MAG: hypothetical protein CMC53_03470 [Flavobacteriaceae bacterium]|nr:hypothetical protein [Flavobacteriaceae bacterium]